MSTTKYKVGDLAKDFNVDKKELADLVKLALGDVKASGSTLTLDELNLIFNMITFKKQIESFEVLMSSLPQKKKEEAKKEEVKKEEQPASTEQPKETIPSEVENPQPEQVEKKPEEKVIQSKVAKTHNIETRAVNVDLRKYDESVEKHLEGARVDEFSSNKQKLKKQVDKKQAGFGNKRRQEEQEKLKKLEQKIKAAPQLKVLIPDEIAVGELAMRLKRTGADVVKLLMKLGVMASMSDLIDFETAGLVAIEMGAKVEREVIVTIEERLIDETEDKEEDLVARDPVVVVMGHVDHGKTSLLDAIRNTSVASGEAGGITQHIGAYRVKLNQRKITFLDTPGHAAFTSMRARGAGVTDIAILVVAADDGIMPQTIEAINHAKAANVPIIIAINKMDKEGANPDKIMQQLTEYELIPEEWGGTTVCCKISAVKNQGIDNLLEMVLLTADLQNLRANPNRSAKGTIIEARLDKGRGPIATVLVQNGTLKTGDVVIAGTTVGKVRVMTDDKGRKIVSAGPSVPVEITGLSEVPGAGDIFYAVNDERMAKELGEIRKYAEKMEMNKPQGQKVSLEDLFSQIEQGNIKDLNIIVKADVKGSVEAVSASLEKIGNEEVQVKVIHAAVGAINESDVSLAAASEAIIVGFNVRPDGRIIEMAEGLGVDIRLYRIIYDCIGEIEAAMKGMLAPKFKEVVVGHAEIRQTFKASKIGTIAGCYVTDGKITRASKIRLLRDGVVVHEGELASLKRFKDDVKEVATGYECGLNIERYNDIKEGDLIEAYEVTQTTE